MEYRTKDGYLDSEIIEAFQQTHGNYHESAKLLGITRQTLWRRVMGNEELIAARKQAAASLLDTAENKLVDLVIKGVDIHGQQVDANLHFKALQYFLTSKGKKRGYEGGGHRRPDSGEENPQLKMFLAMDALSNAIERGG